MSGFKFSNAKSQCIIFSRKRGQKQINVQIDGKNIPNNNTVKILGLKFDTKMNWIHLKDLKTDINQRLNLIKNLSHTEWGGDEHTLIRIHIQLIRANPIESIRNIAQEAPPELRRAEKTLLYAASITRNTDNPANKHIVETIKIVNEDKIQLGSILKVNPHSFPPWSFKLEINMELAQNKKENTNPITY
ncbi:putative RNA-directed DNA polymerase [Aphis craccivora]|uniref:Putative RNA-directed DNA polymerase n=1 Tax=Aphis craccivora TaxID=307492 RepID=A0A6G0Y3C2_APHCR|nr:putative RNA-directed DNA polymerase [Aphis craccivora]